MSVEIIISIITALSSLVGVIISTVLGNRLIVYRIEQLEKKQDLHNSLIDRVYKLEDRAGIDEEKIKVANHRIEDLERLKK